MLNGMLFVENVNQKRKAKNCLLGQMNTMLKCKSCGHKLVKRTALNGSGKTWIEHKGMIMLDAIVSHSFSCGCTNPEPKVIETSEENTHLIGGH